MEAFFVIDVRGRLVKLNQSPLPTFFFRKVWEVDTVNISDMWQVAIESVCAGISPEEAATIAPHWRFFHDECVATCARTKFDVKRTPRGWSVSFQSSVDPEPVVHLGKTVLEAVLKHLVRA